MSPELSALIERRYRSFTLRLAQLSLGSFHVARRLLAKQDRAEFVSLIVAHSEFFLCVRALNINTRRRRAEIANKIYPQIEDFRPKVGDLLIADTFFPGHIGACNQTLASCVVPMGLASDAAHYPIGIKCQVAYRIDPFFFRLEIFGHRRPVWSGQRRVADQVEIWFGATGNHCQANRKSVAAFCLDIAQDSFASKPLRLSPIDKVTPCFAK